MLCLAGLIGTLLMGLLGREAGNDARAWRHLLMWSQAPSAPKGWSTGAPDRCVRGNALACRQCPVHRAAADF